jgi:cellulose synthase/poly-beta-1,6-N-acetylglucosamine synthase-like glycosyltransferase
MFTFLVIWLAAQVIAVALIWWFTFGLGRPAKPTEMPPVAIIVAVKGRDPEFDEMLVRLFEQDYPAFRAIFAVESEFDAAVPVIEKCRVLAPDRVELVVAGEGVDEGQKTTNLIAAISHLRRSDEVVVLADADIWPERDWLKRLVEPLVDGEGEVVSGFPWLIVKDGKLSSYILTALAMTVVTIPRLPMLNGAWGGSTAMTRQNFQALDMAANWRGCLSDDLQLTNVANEAGYDIVAPREVLLRTAIHTNGFADIIAEARRWYMLVRIHLPEAYWATVIGMSFASFGWIAALAGTVMLQKAYASMLVAALALSVLRTLGRARIALKLWGKPGLTENMSYLRVDWLIAPIAMLVSAICGWSALFLHRTTWSGTTYEINGRQDVTVIERRRTARVNAT